MAAMRMGIRTVIIPEDNKKDLDEIDPDVRAALEFMTTDHVDRILDVALVRMPAGVRESAAPRRSTKSKTAEVRQ